MRKLFLLLLFPILVYSQGDIPAKRIRADTLKALQTIYETNDSIHVKSRLKIYRTTEFDSMVTFFVKPMYGSQTAIFSDDTTSFRTFSDLKYFIRNASNIITGNNTFNALQHIDSIEIHHIKPADASLGFNIHNYNDVDVATFGVGSASSTNIAFLGNTSFGGFTISSAVWQGTDIDIAYLDTLQLSGKYYRREDTLSILASKNWSDDRFTPLSRSITISANTPLSSSAGAQDLSANRTWTLSVDTSNGTTGLTTLYQNSLKQNKSDSTIVASGLYWNAVQTGHTVTGNVDTVNVPYKSGNNLFTGTNYFKDIQIDNTILENSGKTVTINDSVWIKGHLSIGINNGVDPGVGISYVEEYHITDNLEKFGIVSAPRYYKTSAPYTYTTPAIIGRSILDSINTQDWTANYGLVGVEGSVQSFAGATGTIKGAMSFLARNLFLSTTDSIDNSYGVYVESPPYHNKIHNVYGLYLETHAGVGSGVNYSIYSGGGDNYLGGALTLGAGLTGTTSNFTGAMTVTSNTRPTLNLKKDASVDNFFLSLTNTASNGHTWSQGIRLTNNNWFLYNLTKSISPIVSDTVGRVGINGSVNGIGTTGQFMVKGGTSVLNVFEGYKSSSTTATSKIDTAGNSTFVKTNTDSLAVNGKIRFSGITTDSTTCSTGQLWLKVSDGTLHVKF